jgi:hypothetical protein
VAVPSKWVEDFSRACIVLDHFAADMIEGMLAKLTYYIALALAKIGRSIIPLAGLVYSFSYEFSRHPTASRFSASRLLLLLRIDKAL